MKHVLITLSAALLFLSCENDMSKEPLADLGHDEKTTVLTPDKNEDFSQNNKDTVAIPQQTVRATQNQQTPSPKIDWDKKIIKNATLNLEVKDFNAYSSSLREKIRQFGGYVAQEEQNQSEYKIENTVIIKVPVDQFDDAVNSIITNVKELKDKKITSQDVTNEVVDTRSRMETKKQVRLRYLDLLKQARNMEEILSVQSEINGVQEQIESAAGRMEYLQHASALSTIHLAFFQVLNEAAIDADKPSFATRLTSAFGYGWNWIGELAIGIISIWPLLLLIFSVVFFYKRSKKSRIKQA